MSGLRIAAAQDGRWAQCAIAAEAQGSCPYPIGGRMPKSLMMCTLCQRIQRGDEWVKMEQAIRELRSYELEFVPHLQAVICDQCRDAIVRRRTQAGETRAA
jgi:hypothetical protein